MQVKNNELPRTKPRFSIHLFVECSTSAHDFDQRESDGKFGGVIENISSGGACVNTNRPLRISEVLRISFPIGGSISGLITMPRTLVEVKWTRPISEGRFTSGVRFLI